MEGDTIQPQRSFSSPVSLLARLYRYKILLKRRWWVVFLMVSVVLCIQAVLLEKRPRTYISEARMWMSGKINLTDGSLYTEEHQNFFGTMIELMKSVNIRDRARARVQTLRPELNPIPVELQVGQQPKADIWDLRATGSEPLYVQAFLDSVMDEYLDYKRDIRQQISDASLVSVAEQLASREKDLKAVMDILQEFQRTNNLAIIQEQNSGAAGRLTRLNNDLSDLKMKLQLLELISPEQLLEQAQKPGADSTLPDAKGTGELSPAQARYAKIREDIQIMKISRDEWAAVLKDAHPKMKNYKTDIERLEKALELQKENFLEEERQRRQSLLAQIQNLEDSITDWEARALEANHLMIENGRLTANVNSAKSQYDRVLSLIQNLEREKKLGQENVSVMERACPALPTKPDLLKNLALGCFAGLFLGFGLLFLMDHFDDRITTVSELAEQVPETLVGQIPELDLRKTNGQLELLKPDDSRHTFAEAFRNVRSSLLFMDTKDLEPKTLLITSAIPNEGKSTVTANLALTMANAGNRVLLIDADLRRGALHKLFGLPGETGLTEVLRRETSCSRVVQATVVPNLFLIPRGKSASNAGELFLSPAMALLLKEVQPQYDFVVFDSAPVLATDDTATLAPKLDGVLFVVRGSFTSARLVRNSLEQLYHRKVTVLGLIFNRLDTGMPDYDYYKYNEYHASEASD